MTPFAAPLLASLFFAGVWTVDDDAPADFSDIQSALNALPPGETIVVFPGTYDSFKMTKSETLLALALGSPPQVPGTTPLLASGGFVVAGFEFRQLIVKGVAGPATVVDCTVGVWKKPLTSTTVRVEACQALLFQRCTVTGAQAAAGSQKEDGGDALLVDQVSVAQVVRCVLHGGAGHDYPSNLATGTGGAGLVAANGSKVVVSSCPTVVGGRAGMGYCGFDFCDGIAGDGIMVENATVTLRGRSSHVVKAGAPLYGTPGAAVRLKGGKLVWSGVALSPSAIVGTGSVHHAQPDDPVLESFAQPLLGGLFEMHVYGPIAEPWVPIFSAPGTPSPLPGPLDPVWPQLPPWSVTTGVALGAFPQIVQIHVPPTPSVEGLSFSAQAFFPNLPDSRFPWKYRATNVVVETVRF